MGAGDGTGRAGGGGLRPAADSRGYRAVPQRDGQDDADNDNCGFFCLQPRWMRPLANRFTYLLVYCSCGLIQGMWYTYFVSILTTVEKTFKFPSSVTGIVLAGNDLAQIFFAVLISYYGGRGNRPRWVGAGMLLNALGCLLSALPQFVWGPDPKDISAAMTGSLSANISAAGANSVQDSLCELSPPGSAVAPTADPEQCDAVDVSLVPVILLFVSQFVSGIGATAYYTLGLTYLDDSVDKKQSPVMFSISAGLRVMGPMLGFMLGSFSLSKFVVPSMKPTISQKDPRWIGAWWLGFFVLAILLVAVSLLMCLFPKSLRHTKQQSEAEQEEPEDVMMDKMMGSMSELHTGVRPAEKIGGLQGLRQALSRLVRNPLLMVLLLNVVFAVIGFIGYFTFMPKYQQAAFRQSASKASLFSGLSGVLVTLAGYIASGIFIKVVRPRAVFVTGYSALVSGVQTCCMFALMAVRCGDAPMHGAMGDGGQFMLSADCNAGCDCDPNAMAPVCSQDGMANFFSPCFAGCQTLSTINGTTTYGNCSCIVEVEGSSPQQGGGIFQHVASATSGLCDIPCESQFITYMVILAVMKFVGSTNRTGGMLVFFRSVSDADKSLAIGLATALMSVFAFIPAPILFGAVVDQTCMIWEEKPCGGRGNCIYYDTDKLRVYLHTAVIIPFAISFALDMVVIYLSRNLKLYGEDEENAPAGKNGKKPTNGALDIPM